MARRRTKRRTHVGAHKDASFINRVPSTGERIPKSMVLRMGAGEVGPSVSQLVKDVRAMMEPHTASRLKERRSNKLKDYTTMAGPLGVTHLLLFSRSSTGNTNLRIAMAPRGPTFFFQVESYSLCKDVKRAMRHPKGSGKETLQPPLLVMNNFITPASEHANSQQPVPKHLETLTTSMFQSLFPSISPQDVPLSSIRRVLLLNREPVNSSQDGKEHSYVINLRHYAITTKATGLSRGVRRLRVAERPSHSREKKKRVIPNLGKLEDVADYFLDPSATMGYTSASESEAGTDAEVEVMDTHAKKLSSYKKTNQENTTGTDGAAKASKTNVEKRAVKLDELGPRLRLRLIKVEEGLCGGRVMWHDYMSKSKDEVRAMEKVWEQRRKEKEERRKLQQENVERKRKDREKQKGKTGDGDENGQDDEDKDEGDYEDMGVDEMDAEAEAQGDKGGDGEDEDEDEDEDGEEDDEEEVDNDLGDDEEDY